MSENVMVRKLLPTGIDLFEDVIHQDYYYVDKTLFIRDLLLSVGRVNLFTRPRRFGKTLMMSMLKSFFDVGADNQQLFNGLKIMEVPELCEKYMGKYPVVFVSFKECDGMSYEKALERLSLPISDECKRLSLLLSSDKVDEDDKHLFASLKNRTATETQLLDSLAVLIRMLRAYYDSKVILLIDEYDVPLDKAFQGGYYDQMVKFMSGMFSRVFKSNPDLQFSVVTGCLRISKESIFTGANNPKVDTVLNHRHAEYFGFTEADVREFLSYYDLDYAFEAMREWYNGYHFGGLDVYNPWDVINYCDELLADANAKPQSYWWGTSSNEIIKRFIDKADATVRMELEELIGGKSIRKYIDMNLTYAELDSDVNNLWNMLLSTGYLTKSTNEEKLDSGNLSMVIPNREAKEAIAQNIKKWFEEKVKRNYPTKLYEAAWKGDAETLQNELFKLLITTISYFDYAENYYHAFVTGIFRAGGYRVRSNFEAGEGRADIVAIDEEKHHVVIIETKTAKTRRGLEGACKKALKQIREKKYAVGYEVEEYKVTCFGAAFTKKDCLVKLYE